MKAILMNQDGSLRMGERETPVIGPRDVLVEVKAAAVNPVDLKQRRAGSSRSSTDLIGWDAAGIIREAGREVSGLKTGDEVYYAGAIQRDGCFAELQAVDFMLVGPKPKSLSFEKAAALPLTALTAWEGLFEKLRAARGETILIINGGGGVGSIAVQLGVWHGLEVIATASRDETRQWVRRMGARLVIDHSQELPPQLKTAGIREIDCILNTADTDRYLGIAADLASPGGRICCIVSPSAPLDISGLFAKRLELSFEYMFSKALFGLRGPEPQGEILAELAQLVDQDKIQSTLHTLFGGLSVENIEQAHGIIADGKAIGKIVVQF